MINIGEHPFSRWTYLPKGFYGLEILKESFERSKVIDKTYNVL